MTAFRNRTRGNNRLIIEHDNLSLSLINASYQIPRLLFFAHCKLFENLSNGIRNTSIILRDFEKTAKVYYPEMFDLLEKQDGFCNLDIAHIILTCGIYWDVKKTSQCVPGTKITYDTLIQKSIIFPFGNGSYFFPFRLVWDAASFDDSRVRNNKNEIQKLCAKLVPNLDINDLYMGFDRMISKDVINLGSSFERMFASALAAKYYLYCLRNQAYVENGYVTFSELYDGVVPDRKTKEILQQCSLNLTCGIVPDKMEHPNLVLQSNQGLISVISKDSLLLGGDDIKKQMFTRRGSNEKGLPFIFLYLENDEKEDRYDDSVIYLDGGGCCSSVSLNICVSVKKLQSVTDKINGK